MNDTKAQWMRLQRIKAELMGITPGVPVQVTWTQTSYYECWCPELMVFDYDVEDPTNKTQVVYDKTFILVHRKTAIKMMGEC